MADFLGMGFKVFVIVAILAALVVAIALISTVVANVTSAGQAAFSSWESTPDQPACPGRPFSVVWVVTQIPMMFVDSSTGVGVSWTLIASVFGAIGSLVVASVCVRWLTRVVKA